MHNRSAKKWLWTAFILVCLLALSVSTSRLHGQENAGTIQGTVVDGSGQVVKGAAIAVASESRVERRVVTGDEGKFSVTGLPAGIYTVEISAPGFATQVQHNISVAGGSTRDLPVKLGIASVSEEVTVEAEGDPSIAAQLSPVKSLLDAASARTEITSNYVTEFTSPVTDFADIAQAAPGVVAWDENGVGLGQSHIYYRGFSDDDYTITWDGIPFGDTNDPSHHSWAFVPAPAIGYVDFDRSPGTASDMGLANYGGSIHFFSPQLGDTMNMHLTESYGSFNTNMILGEFNSGLFHNDKANFWFEGHHMGSDGYQTFNYQYRTAGTAKFTYRFSDKTNLALVSTVVIADANTPNNDPYRYQLSAYGNNFLLQNNYYLPGTTTVNGLYYGFYTYHVPTDFEVITFNKDFGRGWHLESKPYTYNYSNHQHYNNNQYSGNALDASNGNTADPVSATSAIDKMNQYNRGGDITTLSAASKYGVFRTGGWFEYAYTNRYQNEANPTDWVDADTVGDLKFHESFITRTIQPFAEYQMVAIPRLTITAGLKDAYYNQTLTQFASNKDVGPLTCSKSETLQQCTAFALHEAGYNNVLPSVETNVRLLSNWSVYGQYGRASIIPFSSIFDVAGAEVQQTPPPTIATTYQGGTVYKANKFSFDADAFHIHFINQYSSYTPTSGTNEGLTFYYATPPSDTNGLEGEGNIAFSHTLSLFLNGTLGEAKYEAAAAQPATATSPLVPASSAAWVADAPHDTETIGLTYQSKGWDFGMFNKRVGSRWEDDGSTHQNVPLPPWWMSNLFLNYTIRNGSHFNNSKIKLSVNNLFNNQGIADITGEGNATTANGQLYTPSPLDTIQLLSGRSVMITFQMGFQPKER